MKYFEIFFILLIIFDFLNIFFLKIAFYHENNQYSSINYEKFLKNRDISIIFDYLIIFFLKIAFFHENNQYTSIKYEIF